MTNSQSNYDIFKCLSSITVNVKWMIESFKLYNGIADYILLS